MSYIKPFFKIIVLAALFIILSLFSNYYSLNTNLNILLSFLIAAIFSIMVSIIPNYSRKIIFKHTREIEKLIILLERYYDVYEQNMNAQYVRRSRGGFTDPNLRKQFEYDFNKYLNQIHNLQEHLNMLESLIEYLPSASEFRAIRKRRLHINVLSELLDKLKTDYDTRRKQGNELKEFKKESKEIIDKVVKELSSSFGKLYKRIYTKNLKLSYGLELPPVQKKLMFIEKNTLKELSNLSRL